MVRAKISSKVSIICSIWFFQLGVILSATTFPLLAAERIPQSERQSVSFEDILELPYRIGDYKFSYGTESLQFGRLWLPKGENNGTVIFIHGGCWMNEYDIDHANAFATELASAGYAVWSLEYRRIGDMGGGWPGTFEDVISGINKLKDLGEFDLDMEKLVLMGHSAGGHLAILAGARTELLEVKPSLVLGLAAITDVVNYAQGQSSCQQSATIFMGGSPDDRPAAFDEVQPANYGVNPNTVLLYGASDQIVPPSQALLPEARSLRHERAGHFDWIHPGTDAFRMILAVLLKEL
jgi:acetyl esterase/lipase